MAYDTQVFDSTKPGTGHVKNNGPGPVASPKGVVTS
jgi:hypothetical protein